MFDSAILKLFALHFFSVVVCFVFVVFVCFVFWGVVVLLLLLFLLLLFFSFFFSITSKDSFRNTTRVSNSLDPGQARRFVGLDLGPNCLQRLSVDGTSRLRANEKVQRLPFSVATLSKFT